MALDPQRIETFTDVARGLRGPINIVLAQVDPDALGAAVVLAALLADLSPAPPARIVYAGSFGHPQNRALANRLNLRQRLTPFDEIALDEDAAWALVDSSLRNDARFPSELDLDPIIVVDHHRNSDVRPADGRFVWIEDVGAACTLMTELAVALDLDLSADDSQLGLLLALGIYTDTKNLVSATSRDLDAYLTVRRVVDAHELQPLIDYSLPSSHFDNVRRALNNFERRGARVLLSPGFIEPADGDDLAILADYFLRMDGVSLVVAWGIIDDKVRISARSSNPSEPLDVFLEKRLGPTSGAKLTSTGRGEGGALLDLGLGLWLSEGTKTEVVAMVSRRMDELVFGDAG